MLFSQLRSGMKKNSAILRNSFAMTVFSLLLLFIFLVGCKEKKPASGTALTFITWRPNQPEVWEEVYEIFERENPDITIVREVGPHSSTAFTICLSRS